MGKSILTNIKEEKCRDVGVKTARSLLSNTDHLPREARVMRILNWLSDTGFSEVSIDYFQERPFSLELKTSTDKRESCFLRGFLEEISDHFATELDSHRGLKEDGTDHCLFKLNADAEK